MASRLRLVCLLALFFLSGGIYAVLGLQPMRFMMTGFTATYELVRELTMVRPDILYPIAYQQKGVVVYDPDRASNGLTLIQGYLPGGPQVRLIDMSGSEIHRWDVDFFKAWTKPDHIFPPSEVPKSRLHFHTQGMLVRPDGSLLVNIGEKGAINMDRCGRVLWTVDRMTHHSVTSSPDGGYYLPGHRPVNQIPDNLLPLGLSREDLAREIVGRGSNPENLILRVDAEGKVVQQISVLQAIVDAGLETALYDGRMGYPLDPTHLNDIEIVTPALAGKIPAVEPGDLLVSLRNMSMLAILDQHDGTIKWHKRGPWVMQHDPDITPDGMIELFNNRSLITGGLQEGSQILAFDPAADETRILHPAGESDVFRSELMGAHQKLPNGNRLIVESTAGRVFEAAPDGSVVWDYVMPYDDEYASLTEGAERVPPGFFDVTDWICE